MALTSFVKNAALCSDGSETKLTSGKAFVAESPRRWAKVGKEGRSVFVGEPGKPSGCQAQGGEGGGVTRERGDTNGVESKHRTGTEPKQGGSGSGRVHFHCLFRNELRVVPHKQGESQRTFESVL